MRTGTLDNRGLEVSLIGIVRIRISGTVLGELTALLCLWRWTALLCLWRWSSSLASQWIMSVIEQVNESVNQCV